MIIGEIYYQAMRSGINFINKFYEYTMGEKKKMPEFDAIAQEAFEILLDEGRFTEVQKAALVEINPEKLKNQVKTILNTPVGNFTGEENILLGKVIFGLTRFVDIYKNDKFSISHLLELRSNVEALLETLRLAVPTQEVEVVFTAPEGLFEEAKEVIESKTFSTATNAQWVERSQITQSILSLIRVQLNDAQLSKTIDSQRVSKELNNLKNVGVGYALGTDLWGTLTRLFASKCFSQPMIRPAIEEFFEDYNIAKTDEQKELFLLYLREWVSIYLINKKEGARQGVVNTGEILATISQWIEEDYGLSK